MGISMKKFSRMTPEQRSKYRANVVRLHRGLLLAHVIGLSGVFLFAAGLMIYHHLTNDECSGTFSPSCKVTPSSQKPAKCGFLLAEIHP